MGQSKETSEARVQNTGQDTGGYLPMTLEAFLEKRGIKPDAKFGDYQNYIEEQQEILPTRIVRGDAVPAEGSIHLALGRRHSASLRR